MDFKTTLDGAKPPLFDLGEVFNTRGATALLARAAVSPFSLLNRHVRGDWGDASLEEVVVNEEALLFGGALKSVYTLRLPYPDSSRTCSETIWLITNAARTASVFSLPEEA